MNERTEALDTLHERSAEIARQAEDTANDRNPDGTLTEEANSIRESHSWPGSGQAEGRHAPAPWHWWTHRSQNREQLRDATGYVLGTVAETGDAARIVACVNYCAGLDATQLEGTALETIARLAALERVAEAAQGIMVDETAPTNEWTPVVRDGLPKLRAALSALVEETS